MSVSQFHLLGYTGTGKDVFFSDIQQHKLGWTAQLDTPLVRWRVYCDSSRRFDALGWVDRLCNMPKESIYRLAFADKLKEDVHQRLGLVSAQSMRPNAKDVFVVDGLTLRQHYIKRAKEVRDSDPTFYARMAWETRQQILQDDPEAVFIVTDHRYANEVPTWDVVSIRLFRSAVPVPAADNESERSLDTHTSDLLLVPDDKVEWKQAIKQFPQYRHYTHLVSLVHSQSSIAKQRARDLIIDHIARCRRRLRESVTRDVLKPHLVDLEREWEDAANKETYFRALQERIQEARLQRDHCWDIHAEYEWKESQEFVRKIKAHNDHIAELQHRRNTLLEEHTQHVRLLLSSTCCQ